MNYLQIMSIIFVCSGVLVVVLALFLRAKENSRNNQARDTRLDYFEYDKVLREIASSVSEMDKTMDEFHKTANSAFQEIDEKYRELQFLYTLVDEKKKEVSDFFVKQQSELAVKTPVAAPKPASVKKPAAPVVTMPDRQITAETGQMTDIKTPVSSSVRAKNLSVAPQVIDVALVDTPQNNHAVGLAEEPRAVVLQELTEAVVTTPKSKAKAEKSSHPRRKDILNLSRQGLSVSEIAEELNVGQDMVKLILQLGKAR